jgi:hypothetical protein
MGKNIKALFSGQFTKERTGKIKPDTVTVYRMLFRKKWKKTLFQNIFPDGKNIFHGFSMEN